MMRKVMITKRFMRDYVEFSHKYTNFKNILLSFIKFSLISKNNQSFNQKDSSMTTASGFRRCHLIHGKAILIYRIEGNELQLCDIVEHNSIESGKGLTTLGNYLKGLTVDDFEEAASFERAVQNNDIQLNSQQIQIIKDIIYELAVTDKEILKDALAGNYKDLMDYIEIGIDMSDNELHQALSNTFSKDELNALIKEVIKYMKINEAKKLLSKTIQVIPNNKVI